MNKARPAARLVILILPLCLLTAGCETQTTALPVQASITQIASSPYFARADAASFGRAEVSYAATAGSVQVPIGDYLFSKTITTLAERTPCGKPVERLSLQSFKGDCASTGGLNPGMSCSGAMTMIYTQNGAPHTVTATIAGQNYGAQLSSVFGTDPITKQVARFVDDLVSAQAAQAVATLT